MSTAVDLKQMDLNNPAHPGHSNYLISTNGLKAARIWHHAQPMLKSVREELFDVFHKFNYERCGFLDNDWNVWNVPNAHLSPQRNYFICDEDAIPVFHEIYEIHNNHIIAIWHTHPNNAPWPSPRDIVGWPNLALGWRYFIVTGKEISEWQLVQDD